MANNFFLKKERIKEPFNYGSLGNPLWTVWWELHADHTAVTRGKPISGQHTNRKATPYLCAFLAVTLVDRFQNPLSLSLYLSESPSTHSNGTPGPFAGACSCLLQRSWSFLCHCRVELRLSFPCICLRQLPFQVLVEGIRRFLRYSLFGEHFPVA